jgi:predicted transposase YdaD
LLHIEFQSSDDTDMEQRLIEYNVLATREHNQKVYSCVIYLRKDSNIPESPLVWEMPDGEEILRFNYKVIKLWEISAEAISETGLIGLLPLVPLAQDGGQYSAVEAMIHELAAHEEYGLLQLAKTFASLVFKDNADREWLERGFAMYRDLLEDSWVYQEIEKKGIEKGLQEERRQELQRLRKVLLTIVQRHFPEMLEVTRKQAETIQDPELLQNLTVAVSLARNIQEMMQALLEAGKSAS